MAKQRGEEIRSLTRELAKVPGAVAGQPAGEPEWVTSAGPRNLEPLNPWVLDGEERARVGVADEPGDQPARTDGDAQVPLVMESSESAESATRDARRMREVFEHGLPTVEEDASRRAIEALAWYRSFRFVGHPWGVFVRDRGLVHIALDVLEGMPCDLQTRMALAFHALVAHELTHFRIDRSVAQFELLQQRALWLPRKSAIWARGEYDADEEVLANAQMLRAIAAIRGRDLRVSGRTEAFRSWTRTQPRGYQIGHRYTSKARFAYKMNRHGATILRVGKLPRTTRELVALYPLVEQLGREAVAEVPLYLVRSRASTCRVGDVGLFPRIDIVGEDERFKRDFEKASERTQRDYYRWVERLSHGGIANGARLQKWEERNDGNIYSLRLNDGDRLHLQHLGRTQFVVVGIGSHKSMGHG